MKFKLQTAGYFYHDQDKQFLETLGFRFIECDPADAPFIAKWRKDDESPDPEIEINTLEELLEFVAKVKNDVVLNSDRILIYDNYLE